MTDHDTQGELVTTDVDQFDLNALIPLGQQLIENNYKEEQAKIEVQMEKLELAKDRLRLEMSTFSHKFWLLVLISGLILAMAGGLIFLKDDTGAGMTILSHVGAIIAGLLAGAGFERSRSK